nr:hypothetical protein [[Eubacterium] cellulosolvens]
MKKLVEDGTLVRIGAGTYYTIMYIYEDLEGNAEIGDLQNIEMGYR